ncbi:MAG: PEP-CTERM sorting domain-containing protein [Planctomycetota bacterium]
MILLAATPAMADQVLGINEGTINPSGGIYLIDTVTGAKARIAPTHPNANVGSYGPNSLAIGEHGMVYYSSHGQDGGDSLFAYNLYTGVTTQFSQRLSGTVASGSFYDGKYYYIPQGSSDLHEVEFNLDGSISDAVIASGDPAWFFGDIAITDEGMLYGSANRSGEFFSMDLTNIGGGYTHIATGLDDKMQLAFAGGTLYGLVTNSGRIYRINVGTGFAVQTGGRVGGVLINDLAGPLPVGAVPEPAALGLLVLGLGAILYRRRMRQKG